MLRKLQVVAVLLCTFSYSTAETAAIGTASARGDIRVDNYLVKGNTTLFSGSLVETREASADVRLDKNTQITIAANSRATLYKDHLVLQRGKGEFASLTSFEFEANGLHVIPSKQKSRAVISLGAGNTVEVAAEDGSFLVSNDHGVPLAQVQSGTMLSFAVDAGENAMSVTDLPGTVSYENGHYYLASDEDVKYELTGKNLNSYVGAHVVLSGMLQASDVQGQSTISVGAVNANEQGNKTVQNNGDETSRRKKVVVAGVLIAAATFIALWTYEWNQTPAPASR
jgi:hypothetical protein